LFNNFIVLLLRTPASTSATYLSQNPLHTFPRNFSLNGEVANLLRQQVCICNKLATSRCNGIWETTRQNRHRPA